MRASRTYAVYGGREYPRYGYGEDYVLLGMPDQEWRVFSFPDELERGEGPQGSWLMVPTAALDRLINVGTSATWRGAQVGITWVEDDEVGISFMGDPAFAKTNGLVGDQYNGWDGSAPRDELTDVRETVRELPTERESKSWSLC